MTTAPKSRIHIGVGGWTFEPWRNNFYPAGLPHARELEYASRHLNSIEINGTFYRSQKPETFAKWHDETPDDFVFALKGPRFTTNRRVLAEAGESVERFLNSGVLELRNKLGPINWQLAPTKKFDPEDCEGFLKLLPKSVEGQQIRHAIEVRHDSFKTTEFVELARNYSVAVIIAGDCEFPQIADLTAPFVYARIMGTSETEPNGYAHAALDRWAKRAACWSSGDIPSDLETLTPGQRTTNRDVFLYVISGHKPRNPAAAMALIARLT